MEDPVLSREKVRDLLFGVQVLGAVVFCSAYINRALSDITGSSVVQFGLVGAYLLLHLWLTVSASRETPTRANRQLISIYLVWIVMVSGMIVTTLLNPDYRWTERETGQLLVALGLTVAIAVFVRKHGRDLYDPAVRAYLAIAYKSVPQALLGWKFLVEGASGTPALSIVVGHVTILLRLVHMFFDAREAGKWDRNRRWLVTSETLNELSWLVATAAWLYVT